MFMGVLDDILGGKPVTKEFLPGILIANSRFVPNNEGEVYSTTRASANITNPKILAFLHDIEPEAAGFTLMVYQNAVSIEARIPDTPEEYRLRRITDQPTNWLNPEEDHYVTVLELVADAEKHYMLPIHIQVERPIDKFGNSDYQQSIKNFANMLKKAYNKNLLE